MNRSFKLSGLLAAALLAIASVSANATPPAAPSVQTSLDVSGRTYSSISTYATAAGNGGSLSHAESTAGSAATGTAAAAAGTVSVTGAISGYNTGMAYNTSVGSGTGSATSTGWSDATVTGSAAYAAPNKGTVSVNGTLDGGMIDPVRNGTDVNISAGRAQDGFVSTTYAGTMSVVGTVLQTAVVTTTPGSGGSGGGNNHGNNGQGNNCQGNSCGGNNNGGGSSPVVVGTTETVTGSIVQSSTANGEVFVGAVTFTGGTPAGQTAAVRNGNTGVEVTVGGQFSGN